jgi:hypothetical protein
MKKTLLVLLPLLLVTLLAATHLTPTELASDLELTYGGDYVTRAIMNGVTRAESDNAVYSEDKHNGGWFDNRLRFELNAKLNDKIGIAWKPQIGYNVFTGFGTDSGIKTRELYMDYSMDMFETTVRMGRQYWCDHRSLVLDDYFAGFTADMKLMGFDAEAGFLKGSEGALDYMDDQQALFFNLMGKAPINWGTTFMWGQNHVNKTADLYLMPYAGLEAGPMNLDLTLVLDNIMFTNAAGDADSEMGIGIAAKAGIDVGVKLGADVLMITEEGITTFSSYYDNGLYLFGNKLPYDGVQISDAAYSQGDRYFSGVVTAGMDFSDKIEAFGAVGLVAKGNEDNKDAYAGFELNAGLNYKITDSIMFCPVIALGGTAYDTDIDDDDNDLESKSMYMLGGLIKAEF